MSSYFPTSASRIACIRADGPPAVRERRVADDTSAERSSSHRGVQNQHISVLHFVKECLPTLLGMTPDALKLRVVTEDVVVEQDADGADRIYRDCVLEALAGLSELEVLRAQHLTRSLVQQLSAVALSVEEVAADIRSDFVRDRLATAFDPDSDSADAALLPLLGRTISRSFILKISGLEDLQMSGTFVSAPEFAAPAKEQVLKGRIGAGSFLTKKKQEIMLVVDAPARAKKKHELIPVEYHPNQHEAMVYPLLRDPGQIVYIRVKSSKVQRGDGSTSNPYQLVAVLSPEEVEEIGRGHSLELEAARLECI